MDTSETYIKMRRKAIPDLGMGIKPADDSLTWHQYTNVYTDELANYYFSAHQDGKDITCQLERQDQLQEMSGLDWRIFDKKCLVYEHPTLVPTKEQAGIRVVMKEKYNKTWNGEDWVK